jgi:TetR/AcrR family transcriptional repressor of mexJK operon
MGSAYKKLTVENRSNQTRELILQAATELLLKEGYNGFTINRLIAYMGGSKKSIYKYFTNKDGLILAIIDNQILEMTKSLDDLDFMHLELKEALEDIGIKTLNVIMTDDVLQFRRLIVHESPDKPHLGQQFYQDISSRSYKLLAKYFEQQMKEGKLVNMSPLRLARHYWAMMMHFQMVRLEMKDIEGMSKTQIRDHVKATVDDFMLGYAR